MPGRNTAGFESAATAVHRFVAGSRYLLRHDGWDTGYAKRCASQDSPLFRRRPGFHVDHGGRWIPRSEGQGRGPESRQSRSGSCRDDNNERRSWGSPGPCLLSSAACEMLRAGVGTDAHLANANQGAEEQQGAAVSIGPTGRRCWANRIKTPPNLMPGNLTVDYPCFA